jgi:hypothetical protein
MDDQSEPASGTEAFSELERFLERAAQAHTGLSEVERESERRGRELVRVLLQAHLDTRGDGDVADAIIAQGPEGPVRLGYKRRYARSVVTLFGEVRVTRMGYGAPGHEAIYPLDRELRLPRRIYSYEYQRRRLRAVVCSPFDEAISFVGEMTGVIGRKRQASRRPRAGREWAVALENLCSQLYEYEYEYEFGVHRTPRVGRNVGRGKAPRPVTGRGMPPARSKRATDVFARRIFVALEARGSRRLYSCLRPVRRGYDLHWPTFRSGHRAEVPHWRELEDVRAGRSAARSETSSRQGDTMSAFFIAVGQTGPVTEFERLSFAGNDDGDVMAVIRHAFAVSATGRGGTLNLVSVPRRRVCIVRSSEDMALTAAARAAEVTASAGGWARDYAGQVRFTGGSTAARGPATMSSRTRASSGHPRSANTRCGSPSPGAR